jgi:translation initiation factor 1 (eIF-1/SUI1)
VHCLSYSSNFGSKPKSACACPNLSKKQGNKIIIAEDTYLHPGAFIFYIEQLETLDVKNKASALFVILI